MTAENDRPVVLDLDDPYFDGQTLPDALRDYEHVHSTTGVCVKAPSGRFCVFPPGQSAEKDAPAVTYDDDRYGMMRVHIAARRADLACENYTRNALRNFAKAKGLTPSISRKRDLAWRMAQAGLICRNGYLRDGFPTRVFPPGTGAGE